MPDATAQKKFSGPSCGGDALRKWQGNDWQGNREKQSGLFFIPLPNIPLPIFRFPDSFDNRSPDDIPAGFPDPKCQSTAQ